MQPFLTLRVARPSASLDALLPFYVDGLGMEVLFRFDDHDGFDGMMIGRKGWPYHLEFTHAHGGLVRPAPTPESLLVFYYPEESEWRGALARMSKAGFDPVRSFNPYWDRSGRTIEDPDGYRVVLHHGSWPL